MKTSHIRRSHSVRRYPHRRPYPNAADAGYFAGKLLEAFAAVVSGFGFMTVMFFLITI